MKLLKSIGMPSVSYTHLDVYKRQTVAFTIRLSQWTDSIFESPGAIYLVLALPVSSEGPPSFLGFLEFPRTLFFMFRFQLSKSRLLCLYSYTSVYSLWAHKPHQSSSIAKAILAVRDVIVLTHSFFAGGNCKTILQSHSSDSVRLGLSVP